MMRSKMFTVAIEIDTDDRERINSLLEGLGSVVDMIPENTTIQVWPGPAVHVEQGTKERKRDNG